MGRGGAPGLTEHPGPPQTPQVRGADRQPPVRGGRAAGAVRAHPRGAVPAAPPPLAPCPSPPGAPAAPRPCGTSRPRGGAGARLLQPGINWGGYDNPGAPPGWGGWGKSPPLAPQGFTPESLPPHACHTVPVFCLLKGAVAALARRWVNWEHWDAATRPPEEQLPGQELSPAATG